MGLSQEQILASEGEALISQVKLLAGGHGVDIIFSGGAVDANISSECWRSIARYGRFIDFGRKDVLRRRVLDTLPLNQGANFFSFDLLDLHRLKPHVLTRYMFHQLDFLDRLT